jgi:hypothetical protein
LYYKLLFLSFFPSRTSRTHSPSSFHTKSGRGRRASRYCFAKTMRSQRLARNDNFAFSSLPLLFPPLSPSPLVVPFCSPCPLLLSRFSFLLLSSPPPPLLPLLSARPFRRSHQSEIWLDNFDGCAGWLRSLPCFLCFCGSPCLSFRRSLPSREQCVSPPLFAPLASADPLLLTVCSSNGPLTFPVLLRTPF